MRVRAGAFQLAKKGVSRFDFRDPYHIAAGLSWRWFFVVLLAIDLAINVIFAAFYMVQPGSISGMRPGSFADAFFFSIETLATVGYGEMAPANPYGHVVAATEILCGLGFTAIATGLIFVRFSRPKARILYAEKAVVTRYKGKPTLMIRIGNGRLSLLVDASARLGALMNEETEGTFFRRIHDLRLSRSTLPIFGLTWTLMHPIDEESPLYGHDSRSIVAGDIRLFLSVDARDPTLEAYVHDIKDYGPSEILFGARYSDAVSIDDRGQTIADLTRIHLVEPEEVPDELQPAGGLASAK
ncbi:MAG: hypothetical protein JO110_11135 [Acetobacteraceae bacterium]|nr:hypothetical protein [Acetobacteraceae bacterium]